MMLQSHQTILLTTGSAFVNNIGVTLGGVNISFNKNVQIPGVGPAYDPTLPGAVPFFTGTVAHEIGHVLGLNDTGEVPCHATSTSVMGPGCATNNQGTALSRPDPTSSAPTDCDKATVAVNISNPLQNGVPSGGGGGGV